MRHKDEDTVGTGGVGGAGGKGGEGSPGGAGGTGGGGITVDFEKTIHELRRLAVIIFALGIVLFSVLAYTAHQTSNALNTANDANRKVVALTLIKEQVCSKNHQGKPCRELFERLKASLSDKQRFVLGCDSLAYLHLPELNALRAEAHCPPASQPTIP